MSFGRNSDFGRCWGEFVFLEVEGVLTNFGIFVLVEVDVFGSSEILGGF